MRGCVPLFLLAVFISTLYQLSEEEVRGGYSILPEHSSPFTQLHTDKASMEVGWKLIDYIGIGPKKLDCFPQDFNPEISFLKIEI